MCVCVYVVPLLLSVSCVALLVVLNTAATLRGVHVAPTAEHHSDPVNPKCHPQIQQHGSRCLATSSCCYNVNEFSSVSVSITMLVESSMVLSPLPPGARLDRGLVVTAVAWLP